MSSDTEAKPLIDDGWWGDYWTIEIIALVLAPLVLLAAPFAYAYWWWRNRE